MYGSYTSQGGGSKTSTIAPAAAEVWSSLSFLRRAGGGKLDSQGVVFPAATEQPARRANCDSQGLVFLAAVARSLVSLAIQISAANSMELFFSHPLLGMFVGFSIVFAPVGFVVVVSNAIFDINYKYAQFQRKIYNNARIDEQSGIDSYNYTPKKLIGWNRF